MHKLKYSLLFFYTGAGIIVLIILCTGIGIKDYRWTRDYISESFATGTPYSIHYRLGFVISGLMLSVSLALALLKSKQSLKRVGLLLLLIFYGLATSIVGIFPCDAGCEFTEVATTAQGIHMLIASITYVITPIALLLLGINYLYEDKQYLGGQLFVTGILLFYFIREMESSFEYAGLWQRMIELVILINIYCVVSSSSEEVGSR